MLGVGLGWELPVHLGMPLSGASADHADSRKDAREQVPQRQVLAELEGVLVSIIGRKQELTGNKRLSG